MKSGRVIRHKQATNNLKEKPHCSINKLHNNMQKKLYTKV